MKRVIVFTFCAIFGFASMADADAVRYVAKNGSDTENDGLSAEKPFASLQHALEEVAAAESPVVYVASGTYEPTTATDSLNYSYSAWELTNGVSVIGTGASAGDTIFLWKNVSSK